MTRPGGNRSGVSTPRDRRTSKPIEITLTAEERAKIDRIAKAKKIARSRAIGALIEAAAEEIDTHQK